MTYSRESTGGSGHFPVDVVGVDSQPASPASKTSPNGQIASERFTQELLKTLFLYSTFYSTWKSAWNQARTRYEPTSYNSPATNVAWLFSITLNCPGASFHELAESGTGLLLAHYYHVFHALMLNSLTERIGVVVLVAFVLAGIAGTIYLHLFDVSSLSGMTKEFISSLHAPGFAVVTALALFWARTRYNKRHAYLFAAALAFLLGLLSEVSQIAGPRDAGFSDLAANTIGIVAALGILALFDRDMRESLPGKAKTAVVATTAIATLLAVTPSTIYAYALTARYAGSPTLVSFDRFWEPLIYGPREASRLEHVLAPGTWDVREKRIVRLTANPDNRLLFRLEPVPDWTGYQYLVFTASSADDRSYNVSFVVRDTWRRSPYRDNAYIQPLLLTPQPQEFRIPIDAIRTGPVAAELDTSSVGMIYLFAPEPDGKEALLLSGFRLE